MKKTFKMDLWGLPYLGIGKLTLIFSNKTTYTFWTVFITPWISFGIHIPIWKNKNDS